MEILPMRDLILDDLGNYYTVVSINEKKTNTCKCCGSQFI
jgi:hypothetical protein